MLAQAHITVLIREHGIPVVGCNTLSSAICMDKDRAHKLVSFAGITVPESVTFKRFEKETAYREIKKKLCCPLFVKPVRSGSSFGITRINEIQQLDAAVEFAFQYDMEVIVEEAVNGFEVGCAILGNDMPYLLVKSSDALKIKKNGQGHDHLVSSRISMIFTGGTYGKSECKKIDSLQREHKRL